MTGDQSRQLSVGDRVCWGAATTDLGTVTERNWGGITIKWDNRSKQGVFTTTWLRWGWCRSKKFDRLSIMAAFSRIFSTRTLSLIAVVLSTAVTMKALSVLYDFSWAVALTTE
jgi:hypothetical protein